ncbi:WxL domain-containing protein [Enterococcus malodoratus]|uniref:WxL domain-containing protein n=1 Tax=Enterococcus malodoratus TaxID=71451 RepID=UPI0022E0C60F|nr:WxL domain-containing protein [Enterococcus malodoratus]
MRLLKKNFTKIGFLILLLGSMGISQEAQAAPPPVDFKKELALDFDMRLQDGTAYNDAIVLVDIEDETSYPTKKNTVRVQDISVTPLNGNYHHSYGIFDMGNWYDYPIVGWSNFSYIYYTNLRIVPKKNIKSITLGSVKTFRSIGDQYAGTWQKINSEDKDYPLSDSNNKFNNLGNGTFSWKESNYLTGSWNRPTVEFASIQMGGGTPTSYGAYHTTSVNKAGKKIYFVAIPYEVKENFVDDSGATITPPAGFTQGKLTYANAEQYTHTLNSVPNSYTTGGNTYLLKGSYKGPTKPGTLSQSNPPSITVDYTDSGVPNFDQEGQITVVYALSVKLIEKYVDESGMQIDPAWDSTTPLDIEKDSQFTIPHTIGDTKVDAGGKSWEYIGWKYNTDPAGTKRTTPTTGNISGNVGIEYIYKLSKTTASLDLKPTPQIVDNNDTVSWSSRLENTGGAPLKDLVLKATSNWSTGLSNPVQVTVTPAGGSPQDFTVNSGDWASGVNLSGITIPNGGVNNYADITFTTTASGAVNQVLPAEIEVSGNIPTPVKADNFVRIDDPDEPNLKPVGTAGLINIPDFRFGEVEVKPFAQTKGLDASAYRSGYHPYIRFMDNESTGGWSLSAKLGQFTSGTKTLPTTTTLKLRNGVLMDVQNYNKHNESLSYVDLTGSINIPSDSSTVALTNNTNRGVYHLEYDIANVELDLMAHSGIAGLSYQADMDWTLTTAP